MLHASSAWRMRPIRQGVVLFPSSKPGGYADSNLFGGGSKTFAQLFPGGSLASIRAQGFDNMRLMFDIDTYDAADAGTKATYLSTLATNVSTLIAADFSVVVVPTSVGTFNGNFWDGISGTLFLRFLTHWRSLGATLAALNRSDMIAFEQYNEPNTISQASFEPYSAAISSTIREVAAKESIYVVCSGYQDISIITTVGSTPFIDARCGASFHYYIIGSQAGIGGNDYHKGFAQWVYPPGNSTKAAALAVADTVADALGSTVGERNTVKNNEVTPYYDTPKNQSYMNTQVAAVSTWGAGVGLTNSKILMSEAGGRGDSATMVVTQPSGLTYANRKNCYGMLKTALATQNMNACWQQLFYPESGVPSQGIMTDNTNFTFDAGIIDAIKNGTVV